MIVSRFLLWARRARPGDRAEAVAALARAYLYSDLSEDDRWQAQTALTAMLDDGSALVRLALAETLGAAEAAPRHVILALAQDQPEVAEIVLSRSPVLADCDLVDFAALGEGRIQQAIAGRAQVSRAVSAALAEVGTADALVALASNPGAMIAPFSYARMVERHGGDGPLREALLARADLPVETRQAMVAALAATLGRFVTECGWLSAERSGRITRDARERTTVALSAGAPADDAARLVTHLRVTGQLTPGLILRAVLSGAGPFVEAAFADLSGAPTRRVSAILRSARGAPFRALFAKAGLPAQLRPAFEAAMSAWRDMEAGDKGGAALSRRMVERALAACEGLPPHDSGRLRALLHRYEVEAAREEARQAAGGLADRAALAWVLESAPEALAGDVEPGAAPLAA